MTDYDDERYSELDTEIDNDDFDEGACAFEEVANAQEVQARERQLENSGRHLADKITINGGFDNGGNVDRGIRTVVNNYLRRGLDLQGMVDAANRSFERNQQKFYLGVGEGNQIVLYSRQGLRILSLR